MKKSLGIAVAGAAGRMGRMVMAEIIDRDGVSLVGACEQKNHASIGKDGGVLCGRDAQNVLVSDDEDAIFKAADVVIDFTFGALAVRHSDCAAKHGTPLVIGSTGISEGDGERIRAAAQSVAILWSPNMSEGVHLLGDLARRAARALPHYDAEIVEYHHRDKKDAPSGTALRLGEMMSAARDEASVRHFVQREGARAKGGIGYGVVRGGSLVGEHHVLLIGEDEMIEITHKSFDRRIYARGAVHAALWLSTQKAKLYDMSDVIAIGEQGQ